MLRIKNLTKLEKGLADSSLFYQIVENFLSAGGVSQTFFHDADHG